MSPVPRLRRAWQTLCFPSWTIPLGLLVLLGLSFAWFIPQLGFYWDDWPVIMVARLRDVQAFWPFYQYDRPLSAWTYVLTVPILGTKPIYWQIFTLILRWLTCVLMWWTFRLVWPGHKRLAVMAAFLFAIYPLYTQQSISVAYSQHWICYLLFFLSLAAMLQAWRSPRWFWPLTILSILAFLVEAFTMEYFTALELLRPLLLWLVVTEKTNTRAFQIKTVITSWLPYLAGLVGFIIWRFFFMKLPKGDANAPSLLHNLVSSPLKTGLHLLQIALQDLLQLFISAWTRLINVTTIDVSDHFLLFSWGLAFLVAVGAGIFIYKLVEANGSSRLSIRFSHQAMLVGIVAAILGVLPVWATDRQIIAGLYADRFGLAAMFGASLFLSGLIEWLVEDRRKQILILSLLIGLSAGFHLQKSNEYRWSWVKQTRFYWQLKWRAPQLASGTAIFSDGEIFPYMGIYPTGTAINLVYLSRIPSETLSYWFYSLNRDFAYNIKDFPGGIPTKSGIRNYTFQGNTRKGITIQYSDNNDCLEVLAPGDENAPGLDPITRPAIQVSDLSLISAGPGAAGTPPVDIFGREPAHGWCYLYEKASLARQQGDWVQVVALGEQARSQGFHPRASSSNTPFEWLPFIEGYARTGDWQTAQNLSLEAYAKDSRIDAMLCGLWTNLASATPSTSQRDTTAAAVRQAVHCP